MKRSLYMFNGMAFVAALFFMPASADDAAPAAHAQPRYRLATLQTPASIPVPLGNENGQNVQMTLASTANIDLPREKTRQDYGDIPAAQIAAMPSPAAGERSPFAPAAPAEPASEIWMFLGGAGIALIIAWRRCQWASLRAGAAIATGQHAPRPPKPRPASPIGLSTGHGHLPFGG